MAKDTVEKRILIVEDETPIARALELKLQHEGFATARAEDGQEAIELLEKDSAFDFMLLDLVMPRKNGFEVLEWVRKNVGDVPVMVLTNLSQNEDEKRVRELGVVDFCVKSNVPIAEIIDRIKAYFSSKK